jgi:hypothetical protein
LQKKIAEKKLKLAGFTNSIQIEFFDVKLKMKTKDKLSVREIISFWELNIFVYIFGQLFGYI